MSDAQVAVNHYRFVAYKDGRQFSHECDGQDCHVVAEMEAGGFVCPAPYEDIDYAIDMRDRETVVP